VGGKTEFRKEDVVATITLNRPERHNAIDEEMVLSLQAHLDDVRQDESIRVVVLTGAGEKAFSAGFDIKFMRGLGPLEVRRGLPRVQALLQELEDFPRPTIAALNGLTVGGGLVLAVACDFRIASSHAVLGVPEVRVGFSPLLGAARRLERVVGLPKAKEIVMLGQLFDAHEAERMGLVNKVVPPERLGDEVAHWARALTEGAPLAMAVAKKTLNLASRLDPQALSGLEEESHTFLWGTEDLREGIAAFTEKREPRFKGC